MVRTGNLDCSLWERIVSLFLGSKEKRLLAAATTGNNRQVQSLLAAGANPNAKNSIKKGGWDTPLRMAAGGGHLSCVRALLNAGADPNLATGGLGVTALMAAASDGHLEIVHALLEAKANPNAVADQGVTALTCAGLTKNPELFRMLLKAGADPNARSKMIGGGTMLIQAAGKDELEIVRALLAAGADQNATDDKGETALLAAAREGHVEVTQALLAAGADPNTRDKEGTPVLGVAAFKAKEEVVSALLKAGADINASDRDGVTALMLATDMDHSGMFRTLLAAGADPNAKAKSGAIMLKGSSIRGLIVDALKAGIRAEGMAMLADIMTMKIAMSAGDDKGETTPLVIAAAAGRAEMVQALLDAGADPNLSLEESQGPLGIAESKGHSEIAVTLHRAGARVCPPPTKKTVCDVCNQPLSEGDGFSLTTRQVVTAEGYWEIAFFGGPHSAAQLPDDLARSIFQKALSDQCGQASGWMVCDRCIARFPKVDREDAKKRAREFWSAGAPTGMNLTGDGPVERTEALDAAVQAWKAKTGRRPPV
jgi:ankyrin repeat protein